MRNDLKKIARICVVLAVISLVVVVFEYYHDMNLGKSKISEKNEIGNLKINELLIGYNTKDLGMTEEIIAPEGKIFVYVVLSITNDLSDEIVYRPYLIPWTNKEGARDEFKIIVPRMKEIKYHPIILEDFYKEFSENEIKIGAGETVYSHAIFILNNDIEEKGLSFVVSEEAFDSNVSLAYVKKKNYYISVEEFLNGKD